MAFCIDSNVRDGIPNGKIGTGVLFGLLFGL